MTCPRSKKNGRPMNTRFSPSARNPQNASFTRKPRQNRRKQRQSELFGLPLPPPPPPPRSPPPRLLLLEKDGASRSSSRRRRGQGKGGSWVTTGFAHRRHRGGAFVQSVPSRENGRNAGCWLKSTATLCTPKKGRGLDTLASVRTERSCQTQKHCQEQR